MNLDAQSLPDDLVLLKQMLLSMQADLAAEKAQNQQLTLRLNSLLRQRFGRSSEKGLSSDQLD